jgi:hypothetical protein
VTDGQEVLGQAMEASEIPTISQLRTYEEDQKTCCEALLQPRVPRLSPANREHKLTFFLICTRNKQGFCMRNANLLLCHHEL